MYSAPKEGVYAVAPESIDGHTLKRTDQEIQRKVP